MGIDELPNLIVSRLGERMRLRDQYAVVRAADTQLRCDVLQILPDVLQSECGVRCVGIDQLVNDPELTMAITDGGTVTEIADIIASRVTEAYTVVGNRRLK